MNEAVGQPVRRLDGVAKVTGQALYAGDVNLPDMLYGKCLRSPYACAKIVSIDTQHAAALAGVHAVLTGLDVPDIRSGRACKDIPILARDHVLFMGDKVAAVAAESEDIADEALALIEVKYEELPAVFSTEEAMFDTAPLLHPEKVEFEAASSLETLGVLRMYPGAPNVISHHTVEKGDVERAFREADHIFEHQFSVPSVHQGYLEPSASVVSIDKDGLVDVWVSSKAPFPSRFTLSQATGVAPQKLRFNPVMIGGDFGGKGMPKDFILCYYLALRTRRPVKMVMTYIEELTAGNPRHAATTRIRSALDKQGNILGMQARMIFNSGAYAGFCPLPTMAGYRDFAGPYRVPNCAIELMRVYTNAIPAGHMRSPGCPQINFPVESHLDIVAHELNIDPLEFRRRNAIVSGDLSPFGEYRPSLRCLETIDAGARAFGWHSPKARNIGRGIGLYEFPPGNFGPSNVTLSLQQNGKFVLVVGAPDNGAGFHTIAAQLAAGHLGIPLSDIELKFADTLSAPFEVGPSGSRLTTTINQAIGDAANKMKAELRALAAERLNCSPSDVEVQGDGSYAAPDATIDRLSLLDWAAQRGKSPLVCQGANKPNTPDDVTNFAAQFAEVEIDEETGCVRVKRVVSAHDVGTVINPITHQGQIDGAVIQAFGQATTENLVVSDGIVMTPHLGMYKMPTIMDIPELQTVLVPKGGNALADATAIGEMANVALSAAISNAVFDATGVRLHELPVTAEKIFAGLKKRPVEA